MNANALKSSLYVALHCLLIAGIARSAFAFTPTEDPDIVGRLRKNYAKGKTVQLLDLRGVYFDCLYYSARPKSARNGFISFNFEFFGPLAQLNTQLPIHRLSGMPMVLNSTELFGRVARHDDDPVEFVSFREGPPIYIEKNTVNQNSVPEGFEFVKATPLYFEISVQDGRQVGYTVAPLSPRARKDPMNYRVTDYGMCVTSKYHTRLNNSGVGLPGNTRWAWDEPASSPWGPSRAVPRAY